jgi:hypothetical protein
MVAVEPVRIARGPAIGEEEALDGPMLGFGSFWTARRTLAGIEAMAMLAKGQVRTVPPDDVPAWRLERGNAARRLAYDSQRNRSVRRHTSRWTTSVGAAHGHKRAALDRWWGRVEHKSL